MRPLFTVHAGEFLVVNEIERQFRHVNIWIPAKDTGIDLLVSNKNNTKTVSLQVKFSRDYLVTHIKDVVMHRELRACGWWGPTRKQIEKSLAQYWVFVILGFAGRSSDFVIIRPRDLLKRLDAINKRRESRFQTYLWVTQHGKCYETRGLNRADQLLIADRKFKNDARDFSAYLNDWEPIKTLNG
jgi:hypothetical protein